MKNASFIVHNPSIYWGQTAWCVNSDAKSQGSDLQNCPSVQDTPKINHHMPADQELVRVFLTENCIKNEAILNEIWFLLQFPVRKTRLSSWSASMWWFFFGVSKNQAWPTGSFWTAGDLKEWRYMKKRDFLRPKCGQTATKLRPKCNCLNCAHFFFHFESISRGSPTVPKSASQKCTRPPLHSLRGNQWPFYSLKWAMKMFKSFFIVWRGTHQQFVDSPIMAENGAKWVKKLRFWKIFKVLKWKL